MTTCDDGRDDRMVAAEPVSVALFLSQTNEYAGAHPACPKPQGEKDGRQND